jgi:coenzyme F420-reducing hydrogenase beta subunit/polysaccharide pyruvyl transferase WcaK-like protein
MSKLGKIVDRLTRHRWTGAEVTALMGPVIETYVSNAADEAVRSGAASGGSVSALLIGLLESGAVDGALVCVTSVEGGKVRARYRIARTREEVLAARGSTYVEGQFGREAMPLLRDFEGRLAVVALPCEIALVRRDPSVTAKVAVAIALVCGHTTDAAFVDGVTEKLARLSGGDTLTKFRFRSGHWRGRLTAEYANGATADRPSSFYLLYHNLYYGAPKKCMFCGDHFGYAADITAGDLWLQKYRNDPVKHTALVVKTEVGAAALDLVVAAGLLEARPVPVREVLDGQRRTAPFHYNVTARAKAGARHGMKVPDRVHTTVHMHDRISAGMTLRNHLATQDEAGRARVLGANRRLLKARLYFLKGLESLPAGPLVPAEPEGTPRFSLVAGTVYGNRGAEAMLETAIGRVRDRFPDARFSVFSYLPKIDGELVRDPAVAVRSSTPAYLVGVLFPLSLLATPFARLGGRVPRFFPRSIRELAESRALIDLAGVSFIDGREKFLPFNVLTVLPAMLLGTPVFKFAQAVGPFKNPLNRLLAKWILPRCSLVVPRGATTVEHLEQIRFPRDRMVAGADVAFLFESRDSLSREGDAEASALAAAAREARAAGSAVIGVCPSSVLAGKAAKEGWDYTGFMSAMIDRLAADGHTVLLFPNATRARSEKLRNNDLPVIAEIVAKSSAGAARGKVLAVIGDMNAASLRTVIEACSVVAVSRFHAMVGALSIGVPVTVVGWSHKYLEVMKQFGLEEFVFDYSEHDPAALSAVVEHLVTEREQRAAQILDRLPAVQADSRRQFDEMFRRLDL